MVYQFWLHNHRSYILLKYQKLYEWEEAQESHLIPGMLNRAKTDGPFGIWGHDITDLIYNGHSSIKFTLYRIMKLLSNAILMLMIEIHNIYISIYMYRYVLYHFTPKFCILTYMKNNKNLIVFAFIIFSLQNSFIFFYFFFGNLIRLCNKLEIISIKKKKLIINYIINLLQLISFIYLNRQYHPSFHYL